MYGQRGEWKQHKYIRKEGNRYIYPEDIAAEREAKNAASSARDAINSARSAVQYTVNGAQRRATNAVNTAKTNVQNTANEAQRRATNAVNTAKTNVQNTANEVQRRATNAVNTAKTNVQNTAKSVKENTVGRISNRDDEFVSKDGKNYRVEKGIQLSTSKDPKAYEKQGWDDNVGISVSKTKNEVNANDYPDGDYRLNLWNTKTNVPENEYGEREYGPLKVSKAEDGVQMSLDLQYGKTLTRQIKEETKKKGRKLAYKILQITGE